MNLVIIIILAVLFGSLAALMAFITTYGKYKSHNFPKGSLIKESLRTALIAFVFVFGLAVIVGYLFLNLVDSNGLRFLPRQD